MVIPTTSWDENSPAGSDAINQGDNRIREMKTQVREVMDVDHQYNSSGSDADNGAHKKCSFLEQANLGTGAVGKTLLGSQTVGGKGELVYTDEDDNDVQITSNGNIRAESIAGVYPAANAAAVANIMSLVYPVGSVVTLGVSTNPGTLFGVGTWTAIEGRVVVGIDAGQTEFDTLDETGGAKTHSHGSSGTHTHSVTCTAGSSASGCGCGTEATVSTTAANTGAASESSLQPYIVKYVWQRTA